MGAGAAVAHAGATPTARGAPVTSDVVRLMARIGQITFTTLSVIAFVGAAALLLIAVAVS
jgi:hypothetical protein